MENVMMIILALTIFIIFILLVRTPSSEKARRRSEYRKWVEDIKNDDVALPWSAERPGTCPLPNPRLSIELVPETVWYKNVRSSVSQEEWDVIRKACYRKAGYRCEICGDVGQNQGTSHPVECHEIWHYDDDRREQILKGFIALCPRCHKVKHPGLAHSRGEGEIVIQQLMKINNITREKATKYLDWAEQQWKYRSQFEWDCDISLIKN